MPGYSFVRQKYIQFKLRIFTAASVNRDDDVSTLDSPKTINLVLYEIDIDISPLKLADNRLSNINHTSFKHSLFQHIIWSLINIFFSKCFFFLRLSMFESVIGKQFKNHGHCVRECIEAQLHPWYIFFYNTFHKNLSCLRQVS